MESFFSQQNEHGGRLHRAALPLQMELGGTALDHGHGSGYLVIGTAMGGLQIFEGSLSASEGLLDSFFIDIVSVDGHVGEDTGMGASDFHEASTHSKFRGLATLGVAKLPGLKRRNQRGVRGKDAHLTLRTWQDDGFNLIREDAGFRGYDFKQ